MLRAPRLALLALLVLSGCGGSASTTTVTVATGPTAAPPGPTTTGTPTTPAGQAGSGSPASRPAVHLATFTSPSRNIGCDIVAGGARCDIRNRTWSPPPHPASCPSQVDFGQGLAVDASGRGRFVCAGDTALDPSAAVLNYGQDTRVGDVSCQSRTAGMTCTDTADGHGFFISIQGYRIF